MNLARIYDALQARYRADPTDRRALSLSRKVKKRLTRQDRERDKERLRRERLAQRLDAVRHHIERNHLIVALDCEWTPDRPLTEIGFAIYQDGEIEYRNLRIIPDAYPNQDDFRFGKTELVSETFAIEELRRLTSRADLLVGHALLNDRRQFQIFGVEMHDCVFDTMTYGKAAHPGEKIKLRTMVHRAGFEARGTHNAGNDAAMTLHVALALVGRSGECRGAIPHNEPPRSFPARLVA